MAKRPKKKSTWGYAALGVGIVVAAYFVWFAPKKPTLSNSEHLRQVFQEMGLRPLVRPRPDLEPGTVLEADERLFLLRKNAWKDLSRVPIHAEAPSIVSATYEDDVKATLAASGPSSLPVEIRTVLPRLEAKGAAKVVTRVAGVRVQQIEGARIETANLVDACLVPRSTPLVVVREVGIADRVEYSFTFSDGKTLSSGDVASAGVVADANGTVVRENQCYAIGRAEILLATTTRASGHVVRGLVAAKAPGKVAGAEGVVLLESDGKDLESAAKLVVDAKAYLDAEPELRSTPPELLGPLRWKAHVDRFSTRTEWFRPAPIRRREPR